MHLEKLFSNTNQLILLLECLEILKSSFDNLNFFFSETLEEERIEREQLTANPANFGLSYPHQCACEIPGQVPCPAWKPLPKVMTGKWQRKKAQGEEIPDE